MAKCTLTKREPLLRVPLLQEKNLRFFSPSLSFFPIFFFFFLLSFPLFLITLEQAPLKHLAENLCTLLIQKGIIDAKKLHDEASAIDDTGSFLSLPLSLTLLSLSPVFFLCYSFFFDLSLSLSFLSPGTAPVGKKIVAMAWVDPVFKEKLMKDALATAIEYKLIPSDFTTSRVLTAVEDTPTVHNVIVCTLCSCYPTFVLGNDLLSLSLFSLFFLIFSFLVVLFSLSFLSSFSPLSSLS